MGLCLEALHSQHPNPSLLIKGHYTTMLVMSYRNINRCACLSFRCLLPMVRSTSFLTPRLPRRWVCTQQAHPASWSQLTVSGSTGLQLPPTPKYKMTSRGECMGKNTLHNISLFSGAYGLFRTLIIKCVILEASVYIFLARPNTFVYVL